MRRFEEDHRAFFGGQRRETTATVTVLSRKKPFESESCDRQPGQDQRRKSRGRAGQACDVDVGLVGFAHQTKPGVTDRRHPGVGHDEHPSTRGCPLDQLRHPRGFISLVEGHDLTLRINIKPRQQRTQAPGVLRCDHIARCQGVHKSGGCIAGVTDRCCRKHDQAARRVIGH